MSQQINLLNPALRKTQDWMSALPVAILTGLALLVMLLCGLWFKGVADERQAEAENTTNALKQTQAELIDVSKRIAESKPNQALIDELALTKSKLKAREGMMNTLAGGSLGNVTGFSEYLRGFARQIPGGMWLNGFMISSGGADMEVRGRMVAPTALPEYIRRLNNEAVFQGRSFSALTIKRVDVVAANRTQENSAPAAPAAAPASTGATTAASGSPGTTAAPPAQPVLPPVVEFLLLPTAAQDRPKLVASGAATVPPSGTVVPGALSSEAALSAQVAAAPKPSIVSETLKERSQPSPEKK